MAVQLGIKSQQNISFTRLGKHLVSIQRGRQRLGHIATKAIGCLTNETDTSARQFGQFDSQRMQHSGLRALLGDIAKENGSFFPSQKTLGNRLTGFANLDGLQLNRNSNALDLRGSLNYSGQGHGQVIGSNSALSMQLNQRIIGAYRKQADLPGLLGQLTQTLGK